MRSRDIYHLGPITKPGHGEDTPLSSAGLTPAALVERCLTCTRPECTNCLGPQGRRRPRNKLDRDAARRLWTQGLADAEIARCLKVSASTVGHWRRKEGLPVNPDKWSAMHAARKNAPPRRRAGGESK